MEFKNIKTRKLRRSVYIKPKSYFICIYNSRRIKW